MQWHLTGADVDADADPASLEHFGISIVEGMSAGCVPIALAKGGPSDIIDVREEAGLVVHQSREITCFMRTSLNVDRLPAGIAPSVQPPAV